MLHDPYFYMTLFLGLCLGSFATALAHRIPLGISIVAKERSSCPSCQHDLGVFDLVPVFSWLLLRGRCRYCRAKIGWRYPLIELLTALACIAVYMRFGFTWPSLMLFGLAPVIVAIIDIDLREKIIPDGLNISIAAVAVATLLAAAMEYRDPVAFVQDYAGGMIGGSLVWGGGFLLLRYVSGKILKRETIGLGDIKFFFASGLLMGVSPEAAAFFLILAGGAGVMLALVWRKLSGDREFPFGPAIVLAFFAVVLMYTPDFMTAG